MNSHKAENSRPGDLRLSGEMEASRAETRDLTQLPGGRDPRREHSLRSTLMKGYGEMRSFSVS